MQAAHPWRGSSASKYPGSPGAPRKQGGVAQGGGGDGASPHPAPPDVGTAALAPSSFLPRPLRSAGAPWGQPASSSQVRAGSGTGPKHRLAGLRAQIPGWDLPRPASWGPERVAGWAGEGISGPSSPSASSSSSAASPWLSPALVSPIRKRAAGRSGFGTGTSLRDTHPPGEPSCRRGCRASHGASPLQGVPHAPLTPR